MANENLTQAKKNKQDEFYTQLSDIEKELKHYKQHFKGKTIFCNCDDPEWSNFWKYFELNFDHLGIKKLISTQYIAQLMEYNKKFIVIGNQNAITYKEIFKLIKDNKVWLGYKFGDMEFQVPDYYEPHATRYREDENGIKWRSFGNMCWFTNLDIPKRHEYIILYKNYNSDDYPKYDNYDVINVDKVSDIPMDYSGTMGVPITFIDKYNPQQFEILGIANSARWIGYECYTLINNKKIYNRLIIKKR